MSDLNMPLFGDGLLEVAENLIHSHVSNIKSRRWPRPSRILNMLRSPLALEGSPFPTLIQTLIDSHEELRH